LGLLQNAGLQPNRIRNEFILPNPARSEARELLTTLGFDLAKPLLFIQPFTSNPKKDWPLENYLTLASYWRNQGMQVLFGGGPGDRAKMEPVRAAGFSMSAGAPLLVTAGLIDHCRLMVGG